MSRQFRSLLIKSARIQNEIDSLHEQRVTNWIRLMRLKLLRLKLMNRIRRLAAGARERSFPPALPQPLPKLTRTRLRGRRRTAA